MERGRILGGRRLLIWWICSYIIIMIIPVVTGFSIYSRSLALLEDETIATHQLILTQAVGGIEAKFEELDTLVFQIRNEQEINHLLTATPPLQPMQIYRVSTVMSMLRLYLTANDFVDELAVFYPRMQAVITHMSKYNLPLYYSIYVEPQDIVYRAWLSALNDAHISPAHVFGQAGYYMASISSAYSPSVSGTVVIRLNMGTVREYIQGGNDGASDTIVLDQDGALLLSAGDSARWEGMDWQAMAGNFIEKDGVRYLASSVDSPKTGWRFIRMTPYADVMRKAQPIINNAVLISAITLTVCLLAAFLFAYLNYRPLSRLVRFVARWSGSGGAGTEPEYAYIETQMQQLALDHTQMAERLQRQSEQLGRNYLARLLRTQSLLDDTARDELAAYGIEFPGQRFAVCTIQTAKLPPHLVDQLPLAVEKFLASRIPGAVILSLRVDMDIVCVINSSTLTGEDVLAAIRSLHEYISQDSEAASLICVSLVHLGIYNIPNAYAEAVSAFEQRRVEESQGVVVYSEERRRMAYGDIFYPSGYDTQLINSICAGDMQRVGECIDDIYEQNTHGRLTVRQCGYLGYHLCMSFMKAIDEVRLIYGIHLTEASEQVEQLLGEGDLIRQRTVLLATACDICDRIAEGARSGHLSVDRIMQYVQAHYSDPELNVNTLADGLSMNPSYVSRVFSEKTGESLSAYIQRYRVDASLQSMSGTDSISQIAAQVGYLSTYTFIRTFKKHIGITPGKYRELQKQKLSILSEIDDEKK